jgi:hypothetical protein
VSTANDLFRAIVENDPTLREMFTVRQPAYRYFSVRGCKDMFFWTTEAITHKGKRRYASGIYKYAASRKTYRLTRAKYHAQRKDAKTRASSLYLVACILKLENEGAA